MDVAKEEIVKTEELETRYERYKGILKDLTIMSDVFMRNVFKKRECTEYVLQVIMNKKDLKVIDQVLQKDYKNLQGRSANLVELKNKIEPQYKKLSSENEQIKKLILLLCDYEPSDIFDEQMRELYNEGYEDKSINLTIK